MPIVSEPSFENGGQYNRHGRRIPEPAGTGRRPALGARRASLQEAVSQESGRTEDLVSYSRAFVDAAVEYKCGRCCTASKTRSCSTAQAVRTPIRSSRDFDGPTPRDSTGATPSRSRTKNGEVVTYLALEELMDAAGNYSMENVIDIAQYENGQYLVTITLDEAFLADEDTVYPVTASASSTGWLYHTSMDDTHIMQSRSPPQTTTARQ